jgi:hypothetical protein
MKFVFLLGIFLLGCPKKTEVNILEEERRASLEKLMEQDDEFFDDIPEGSEESREE